MAYNRINKLRQMQEVVEVYCREKKDGISTAYVYREFIHKQFHISIKTLYNYLGTPISRELKIEQEKAQAK